MTMDVGCGRSVTIKGSLAIPARWEVVIRRGTVGCLVNVHPSSDDSLWWFSHRLAISGETSLPPIAICERNVS